MNKYKLYTLTSKKKKKNSNSHCVQNEIGINKPPKLSGFGELEKSNRKFMSILEALLLLRLVWKS